MDLASIIGHFAPKLEPFAQLYKDIHQHPELSRREAQTATVIAHQLRVFGLQVHEAIGGHGVVGILRNGPGKTVLLRAELDALPIEEQTQLPYASTERMTDWWGYESPVMHACGHDMHMACLTAATKLLLDAKSEWSGTLIALFQPNEEHTGGAQAMVDDGLYDRIPRPDVVMAQHLTPIPTGTVSIKTGDVLVSADTVKARIFASLGHTANPQEAANVILIASKIVLRLQDLVGDVSKDGYAAIRCDEIHAGRPGLDWVDHADLVLDVKAYDPKIRTKLLEGTREIIEQESAAAGVAQKPEITSTVRAPLTRNDDSLAEQVGGVFVDFFGPGKVLDRVPSHPCEDFSILATAIEAPYLFWFVGRADAALLDRPRDEQEFLDMVPIEHSPFNHPVLMSTLETGMNALALATVSVLGTHGEEL